MTSLATYGVNAFLRFVVKRSLSKHALTPERVAAQRLSWKGPAPGAGGPASSASPPTPSALSPRSGGPRGARTPSPRGALPSRGWLSRGLPGRISAPSSYAGRAPLGAGLHPRLSPRAGAPLPRRLERCLRGLSGPTGRRPRPRADRDHGRFRRGQPHRRPPAASSGRRLAPARQRRPPFSLGPARGSSPPRRAHARKEAMLPPDRLEEAARAYAGICPWRTPAFPSSTAASKPFPPLMIHVGSEEILLDDSEAPRGGGAQRRRTLRPNRLEKSSPTFFPPSLNSFPRDGQP